MKVEHKYTKCDVCQRNIYGSEHTEITFSYDGGSHVFDSCYLCLTGNTNIKKVYEKIIELIKSLRKSKQQRELEKDLIWALACVRWFAPDEGKVSLKAEEIVKKYGFDRQEPEYILPEASSQEKQT